MPSLRASQRSAPAPTTRGLRERKKRQTRERLAESAWQLVQARGYEQVTVDDIAAAADVSRSTFFRYFPAKEAVLFTWRESLLDEFEAELSREDPGESGFEAVRRALLWVAAFYQRDRAAIVRRQHLINASPALVGFEYEVDRIWEDRIARALAARGSRGAETTRRAQLRAGAILGVVRVTLRHWIASRGRSDLASLGSEALDLLDPDALPVRNHARRRTS